MRKNLLTLVAAVLLISGVNSYAKGPSVEDKLGTLQAGQNDLVARLKALEAPQTREEEVLAGFASVLRTAVDSKWASYMLVSVMVCSYYGTSKYGPALYKTFWNRMRAAYGVHADLWRLASEKTAAFISLKSSDGRDKFVKYAKEHYVKLGMEVAVLFLAAEAVKRIYEAPEGVVPLANTREWQWGACGVGKAVVGVGKGKALCSTAYGRLPSMPSLKIGGDKAQPDLNQSGGGDKTV